MSHVLQRAVMTRGLEMRAGHSRMAGTRRPPSYIEPGSPWQNGYIESFNSRFRDECLSCEEYSTVQEARQIIEQWRQTYNSCRPHSSLDETKVVETKVSGPSLTPLIFPLTCSGGVRL